MKAIIEIKNRKGGVTIQIKGYAVVANATDFHQKLRSISLSKKSIMEINLQEVTSIDVSFLQLIYLAVTDLNPLPKEIKYLPPTDDSVKYLIQKTGFNFLNY